MKPITGRALIGWIDEKVMQRCGMGKGLLRKAACRTADSAEGGRGWGDNHDRAFPSSFVILNLVQGPSLGLRGDLPLKSVCADEGVQLRSQVFRHDGP